MLFVVGVLGFVAAGASETKVSLEEFVRYAFQELGATPRDCPPAALEALSRDQRAVCADLEMSFRDFARSWRRLWRRQDLVDWAPEAGWRNRGESWQRRLYRTRGYLPVWVAFSEQERGLMLTLGYDPGRCEGETGAAAGALPGLGGVSGPVLVRGSYVRPEYPAEARRKRAHGRVVLKLRVAADGTAEVLCVLDARPERMGFEEAAIDAVRRWRYEPARDASGTPVPAITTASLQWEIG